MIASLDCVVVMPLVLMGSCKTNMTIKSSLVFISPGAQNTTVGQLRNEAWGQPLPQGPLPGSFHPPLSSPSVIPQGQWVNIFYSKSLANIWMAVDWRSFGLSNCLNYWVEPLEVKNILTVRKYIHDIFYYIRVMLKVLNSSFRKVNPCRDTKHRGNKGTAK